MTIQIKFLNYPTKVALSEAQRERYYTFDEETGFLGRKKIVPDKYLTEDGKMSLVILPKHLRKDLVIPIAWYKPTNKKVVLYDNFTTEHEIVEMLVDTSLSPKQAGEAKIVLAHKGTLEPILANPRVAGTAKHITINGNYLYQGGNGFVRKKIVDVLRKYFIDVIEARDIQIAPTDKVHIIYEFVTHIGVGNWDLDNHSAFYTKVLQDVLRDKLLYDDTINTIVGKTIWFTPACVDEIPHINVKIISPPSYDGLINL